MIRRRSAAGRVSDMPLAIKLMLPSVTLALVLSAAGSFIVSRYLARQAADAVDGRLTRSAVRIEAATADEVSYLLEAGRTSANLIGVAQGLQRHDADALAPLALQTLVLRTHADLAATVDLGGQGVVEWRRDGADLVRSAGVNWRQFGFVDQLLGAPSGADTLVVGVVNDGGTTRLAVAAPVRSGGVILGATLVGVRVESVAASVAKGNDAPVAFYGPDGAVLASSKRAFPRHVPQVPEHATVRRTARVGGASVATLSSGVVVGGATVGTFATWLPTRAPGLTALALRIGAVFLVALIVVGAMGAGITRVTLRQIRGLLRTHEELARGELDARVDVGGTDELGRLAAAVNTMAEQLQASHSELERRVEARTEELQRLYDESVRATEARSEFFAAISHELRTPLFVILGHAELMTHPEMLPTETGWEQEYGEAITDATHALLDRVNEILDLSKFQRRDLELAVAEVSVADMVRSVAAELAPLARQSGLELSVVVSSGLPKVLIDDARIRDVVRNLVSNAIKFTPENGTIRLRASRRRGGVEIEVSDSGVGIPLAAREHLFEPFYQVPGVDPLHRQASSGLGLALAARIVEAHGTAIRVRSKPGVGSTFSFTLPIVPTRRRAAAPRRPRASRPSANGSGPKGARVAARTP